MKLISLLAVFLGGGLGSVCRYAISRIFINTGMVSRFPWATLIANVLACVTMVLVIYLTSKYRQIGDNWSIFWLIGFCGGFSTFSTFSYENWLLYRDGTYGIMALNILLSVLLCFAVFVMASRWVSVSG